MIRFSHTPRCPRCAILAWYSKCVRLIESRHLAVHGVCAVCGLQSPRGSRCRRLNPPRLSPLPSGQRASLVSGCSPFAAPVLRARPSSAEDNPGRFIFRFSATLRLHSWTEAIRSLAHTGLALALLAQWQWIAFAGLPGLADSAGAGPRCFLGRGLDIIYACHDFDRQKLHSIPATSACALKLRNGGSC